MRWISVVATALGRVLACSVKFRNSAMAFCNGAERDAMADGGKWSQPILVFFLKDLVARPMSLAVRGGS